MSRARPWGLPPEKFWRRGREATPIQRRAANFPRNGGFGKHVFRLQARAECSDLVGAFAPAVVELHPFMSLQLRWRQRSTRCFGCLHTELHVRRSLPLTSCCPSMAARPTGNGMWRGKPICDRQHSDGSDEPDASPAPSFPSSSPGHGEDLMN